MNSAGKLSTYGAALAVVFAASWAVGNAAGPLGADTRGEASHQDGHASRPAQPGIGTAVPTPPPPAPSPHDEHPPEAPPNVVAQFQDDAPVERAPSKNEAPASAPSVVTSSANSDQIGTAQVGQLEFPATGRESSHDTTEQGRGRYHQHGRREEGRGQR